MRQKGPGSRRGFFLAWRGIAPRFTRGSIAASAPPSRPAASKVGDQLPTVRQLAVDLRVNANTVARVCTELDRAGVMDTRRGIGSFVIATPQQAQPPDHRRRQLRAFVTRVLGDAAAAGFSIDDVAAEMRAHRQKGA